MTMCSRAPRLARGCALPNNHSAVYVTRPTQTRPDGCAMTQPTARGSIAGQARLHLQPRKASRPACCMSLVSEELRAPTPAARRSRARPSRSCRARAHLDERQHRAPVPGGGGRPERALEVGVVELGAAIAVRQVQIDDAPGTLLSLIHISEPTRLGMISYAVFCLKKKKNKNKKEIFI